MAGGSDVSGDRRMEFDDVPVLGFLPVPVTGISISTEGFVRGSGDRDREG